MVALAPPRPASSGARRGSTGAHRHWHCYTFHGHDGGGLDARRDRPPHLTLNTPRAVALWFERRCRLLTGAGHASDWADSVRMWTWSADRALSVSTTAGQVRLVADVVEDRDCGCGGLTTVLLPAGNYPAQ